MRPHSRQILTVEETFGSNGWHCELVEGRDVLRAVRAVPGFLDAADLWLVETSPPLREAQRAKLALLGLDAKLSERDQGGRTED